MVVKAVKEFSSPVTRWPFEQPAISCLPKLVISTDGEPIPLSAYQHLSMVYGSWKLQFIPRPTKMLHIQYFTTFLLFTSRSTLTFTSLSLSLSLSHNQYKKN